MKVTRKGTHLRDKDQYSQWIVTEANDKTLRRSFKPVVGFTTPISCGSDDSTKDTAPREEP